MTLRSTNLNLLPVLHALLKEGNVTRAAAELGLSQSATSNALTRLRALMGDPLLVQVGRNMRLTPRAEELLPLLDTVCGGIEHLLTAKQFVPAQTNRTFIVATPDYMALLLGPGLVAALDAIAPGVSVRFVDAQSDLREQLASGAIDVAVVAWIEELAHGFPTRRGYMDRMVGVTARDHPLAADPPRDTAALAVWPQVTIDNGLNPAGQLSPLLRALGIGTGRLRLGASHMLILPLLAARTRCVAVVPHALAEYVATLAAITVFDLPDGSVPIDVCLLWSPLYDADPAQRWFRDVLEGVLATLLPRDPAAAAAGP